jgi:hypothetical protein
MHNPPARPAAKPGRGPRPVDAWPVARVSHALGRGPRALDLVAWRPGPGGRRPWSGARVCVCMAPWPVFVRRSTNTGRRPGPGARSWTWSPGPWPVARGPWAWWPPPWSPGPGRLDLVAGALRLVATALVAGALRPGALVDPHPPPGAKKRAGSQAALALALFYTVSGA